LTDSCHSDQQKSSDFPILGPRFIPLVEKRRTAAVSGRTPAWRGLTAAGDELTAPVFELTAIGRWMHEGDRHQGPPVV